MLHIILCSKGWIMSVHVFIGVTILSEYNQIQCSYKVDTIVFLHIVLLCKTCYHTSNNMKTLL